MEGSLTRAIRKGHWVLLDEINLAPTEVLQSLLPLLDW
jgi:midasin